MRILPKRTRRSTGLSSAKAPLLGAGTERAAAGTVGGRREGRTCSRRETFNSQLSCDPRTVKQ